MQNMEYFVILLYNVHDKKRSYGKSDKYYIEQDHNGIYRIEKPVYDKEYMNIYSNEFEIK